MRQWMHLLNRLGDNQHPCLTPLRILPIHVLFWPSCDWTLWSMYSLLNILLMHQLIPPFCRIYINFIHFTWPDAFSKAIKQIHGPSYMSEVCSDVLFNFPVASLAPVHLLHPNWSFPITPSIFFSICLPSFFITVLAAWTVRLMAQCSLNFAAFGFFKAIIVTSEILGSLSSFIYMFLISCAISVRPMFFQQFEYTPRYIITTCSLLTPYVLDRFSPSSVQDVRAFLVFNYFLFGFNFQVFWLISLIIPVRLYFKLPGF